MSISSISSSITNLSFAKIKTAVLDSHPLRGIKSVDPVTPAAETARVRRTVILAAIPAQGAFIKDLSGVDKKPAIIPIHEMPSPPMQLSAATGAFTKDFSGIDKKPAILPKYEMPSLPSELSSGTHTEADKYLAEKEVDPGTVKQINANTAKSSNSTTTKHATIQPIKVGPDTEKETPIHIAAFDKYHQGTTEPVNPVTELVNNSDVTSPIKHNPTTEIAEEEYIDLEPQPIKVLNPIEPYPVSTVLKKLAYTNANTKYIQPIEVVSAQDGPTIPGNINPVTPPARDPRGTVQVDIPPEDFPIDFAPFDLHI